MSESVIDLRNGLRGLPFVSPRMWSTLVFKKLHCGLYKRVNFPGQTPVGERRPQLCRTKCEQFQASENKSAGAAVSLPFQ